MNLLPFPLFIKFHDNPDAPEVKQHDKALVDAFERVATSAFAQTNPNNQNYSTLQAEYLAIMTSIVRHMPDPRKAGEGMLRGVREIKAAEFYSAPLPYEAALAAGLQYFIPGGPYVALVLPHRIDNRSQLDDASRALSALDASISQGAEHLGWLQSGMPERQVDFRDPDQGTTHHCARSLWHRNVYSRISIEELAVFNHGADVDHTDFEKVDALKAQYMAQFLRYTKEAHRLLSDRIARLNRYWEGRRR